MPEEPKHAVRTTAKSLALIEVLNRQGTAGVTDLADELEMGKSAVHNHLQTLRNHRYVVKEGDKYRLGLKFLEIGGYVRNQIELFRVVEDELRNLANSTGKLVNLAVEEHNEAVFLYHEKGEEALEFDLYTGRRKYLHNTAVGKAMLAHFSDEKLRSALDEHGLPSETEHTITDLDRLRDELESIRDQGYAIDDEESSTGIRCVAAPILTANEVLGALSISGPARQLSDYQMTEVLADRVQSTANVIELSLRYE